MILDFTLNDLLQRLVALLVVVAVAGFAAALVARLLGDPGPKEDGKQTLNPFEHLDYLAVIPFVLFETGWVKPQAVEPPRLRPHPIVGAVILTLATLAIGVLAAALIWALRGPLQTVLTSATAVAVILGLMRTLLDVAIGFALLNLIPIPPLVAGTVLAAISPRTATFLLRFGLIVRILLIALIATGWPEAVARPVSSALLRIFNASG